MIRPVRNYPKRIYLIIILSLLFIFSRTLISLAQQPEGVQWDKAMRIPSPENSNAWFPDLVVDSQGHVHLVWVETTNLNTISAITGTPLEESLYYSRWDGQSWSQPNDLVPIVPDIIRNSIAIDSYDVLHLLFDWKPASNFNLYYKQAPANTAFSAASWTSPSLVNNRGGVYYNDIVVYKNTLHIVYDDVGAGSEDGKCPTCTDIFYRNSHDFGLTWSAPVALFPTNLSGSARVQLKIDQKGTIYVVWDEGWDRRSNYTSVQQYGVYVYSTDAGNTWSSPTTISYPNSTNVQLAVGANGYGGVMLVWRTISPNYSGIYYMWSTDQGQSWSPPKTLPNFVAREWHSPFDGYTMATDSAGHIHLLAVGYLADKWDRQKPPGLYHFEWNGNKWSTALPVYEKSGYPEYPHLVIARGNQLYATWFTRSSGLPGEEKTPHQIWYAHGLAPASAETPVVLPTLTPISKLEIVTMSTPAATPTLTPMPTLDPHLPKDSIPTGATDTIYTETDDLILLAKSLLPAMLIIIVVVISVRFWRAKSE